MKTYSTKSNATRAARAARLDLSALEVSPCAEGGWIWTPKASEPQPEPPANTPPLAGRKANRGPAEAVQKMLALLARPEGATVAEIVAETGWLPHTTRARISATVGKAMDRAIRTEKVADRGRVYRVT